MLMLVRIALCLCLFFASTAAAQDSHGKAGVDAITATDPQAPTHSVFPTAGENTGYLSAPETALTPAELRAQARVRRFGATLLGGLVLSGGMIGLSFLALPVAVFSLPLSPFATAGVATALGNRMGGEGTYGASLIVSIGMGAAGGAMGLALAMGSSSDAGDRDDRELRSLAIGSALGAVLGMSFGAALGYSLSDKWGKKKALSASVAPSAHGMVASLAGRF